MNHSSRRFFTILMLTVIFYQAAPGQDEEQKNPIYKTDIVAAEKLIGLSFNHAERDTMQEGLFEQLKSYQNIRNFNLDNAVPPAMIFQPLPVNFQNRSEQKPPVFSDYSGTRLPKNIEDLAFYSVAQLAELIRTRQTTSVALTEFFLKRLKKYGPVLECVITLTEDLALNQARQADAEIAAGHYRGPLHGIPYGIKDLFATKGYKTTWGAVPYKNQVIDQDATVVTRLEAAGAVLVAKLTLGELAWGDVWFGGQTRNPWDLSSGSSGSSAGSAASVSAGLVPFAIGTETWGSIVSPCTVCGVTGLRPTFGRVSRAGAMALSWTMDKIGPIARSVEDCAIVFAAILGPDGLDQSVTAAPFPYQPEIELSKLRIGYLKADFAKDYPFKKNDSLALVQLQNLGAVLIPMELPDLLINDISYILSAEASAAFDELTRSGRDDLMVRQIRRAWPNEFRVARFIPAVEYINANRIRYLLIQEMAKKMAELDLYLAPSWEGDNLLLTNLTGHPSVVVPTGFSAKGTPTSITFIGNLYDEATILAVAKAYQDASGFHLKHPVLKTKK